MKYFQNLRYQLIIVLTIVLVFAFGLISFLNYKNSKDLADRNEINKTLPLISDNIYSRIEQDLLRPIYVSSLMAQDTFLIDWVASGEGDIQKISRYLGRIKDQYSYSSTFFISDSSRKYYTPQGVSGFIREDEEHDDWYFAFKALNQDYDLDVDTDEVADEKLTIFINHALYDDEGAFLGVAGVGLEIKYVGEILESYREKFNHNIYMVDSSGMIQVHQDESLILNSTLEDLVGIGKMAEEIYLIEDEIAVLEYSADEGNVLFSARYFPDFDWYLIVEQDPTETLESLNANLRNSLFIAAAVTLIVIVLSAWVVNIYQRQLENLASTDDLTGLLNRRAFDEIVVREISQANRYEKPVSMLMIDVDNFKEVNDSFGHSMGDNLLKRLSHTFKENFRAADVICRWGGEEFLVLLPETDKETAIKAAERIRTIIAGVEQDSASGTLHCTVSIGVASSDGEKVEKNEMIKFADKSMLKAKENGRNQTFAG